MNWFRNLRDGSAPVARPATPADRPAVSALLASTWRRHGIAALEEQVALLNGGFSTVAVANDDLVGFLGLSVRLPTGDPTEVWTDVAIAATTGHVPPDRTLKSMLAAAHPTLAARQVSGLVALTNGGWLRSALAENQFVEQDRVVNYVRSDRHNLPEVAGLAQLRPATPADTEAILELNAAAFAPLWRYDPATILTWLMTSENAILAELDGRPAGFALTATPTEGPYAHLIRVATHPEVQGRGVGRQLVADAIRFASESGCAGIALNTQESNTISRSLYHSLGFHLAPEPLSVFVRAVLG
jgi:ribosomal protein S18 acetylase RimI-like enzyme